MHEELFKIYKNSTLILANTFNIQKCLLLQTQDGGLFWRNTSFGTQGTPHNEHFHVRVMETGLFISWEPFERKERVVLSYIYFVSCPT